MPRFFLPVRIRPLPSLRSERAAAGATKEGLKVQLVTMAEPVGERSEVGDAELVRRFQDGDVAAFEELYRRHLPLLLSRLTRTVGIEQVAEELAQETFLRAAQRLPEDVGGRFRSWLLRVGHNLAIDWLRGAVRERNLEARVGRTVQVAGDVEGLDLDLHEDLRSVSDVLRKLPPRYQEVLVQREVYGFDYLTISRVMDVSMAALQTLLHRARGRFREEYARAYGAVA
jgi:RNA polymerase sigma factor (sigma-70 family)